MCHPSRDDASAAHDEQLTDGRASNGGITRGCHAPALDCVTGPQAPVGLALDDHTTASGFR
jgi:hypothetical protein